MDRTARKKNDSDSYATRDARIDDVTATAKQINDISGINVIDFGVELHQGF